VKTPQESAWLEYQSETPPQSVVKGYESEENECVSTLLAGIPKEGGSATKQNFEMLVRTAFQGGLVAIQADAFAAGERKGRLDAWKAAYQMAYNSEGLGIQVGWKIKPIIDRLEREATT
jgi:hypothetical protein